MDINVAKSDPKAFRVVSKINDKYVNANHLKKKNDKF